MLTQLSEYHRPHRMDQALRLLARRDVITAPLAGGTWLVAQRDPAIEAVVDLSALDLTFVKASARSLRLGAMLSLQTLCTHALVQGWADGLLSLAARHTAPRSIRNMATIGGTVVVGDSTAALNLALLALEAEVTIRMPLVHKVPIWSVFADRRTYLPRHALITEITLPPPAANIGTACIAVSRTPHDRPIVNAVAVVSRAGHICRQARLALGGVAPYPLRVRAVESLLLARQVDDVLLAAVTRAIAEAVDPPSDDRASADYRRQAAATVGVRALREAWERTGGKSA